MTRRICPLLVMASLLVLVGTNPGCAGRLPTRQTQPARPAAPPSITAISPSIGSTTGYTPMTITGTGFQSGATVTLDGLTLQGRVDRRSDAAMYLQTPAHDAGTVDVLVTNPDGQAHRLTAAYTYTSPESFDFNGTWRGSTPGNERVQVIIQNNLLVGVSCNGDTLVRRAFSPPPSVSNGAFSLARDDGVAVSGRIVSASAAVGTINLAPCTATRWTATKR